MERSFHPAGPSQWNDRFTPAEPSQWNDRSIPPERLDGTIVSPCRIVSAERSFHPAGPSQWNDRFIPPDRLDGTIVISKKPPPQSGRPLTGRTLRRLPMLTSSPHARGQQTARPRPRPDTALVRHLQQPASPALRS